jgi:hypothetical protein
MRPHPNGGTLSDDNEILETRLSSEYSIVQDKIDKIGAFRFTIRGWTVTLITATMLAVASAKLLSPYSLLFLLPPLLMFWSIEKKQNRNQQIFEDRAFDIEAELRRLRPANSDSRTSSIESPKIAHSLKESSANTGYISGFIADPDRWFYWMLALFVFLVVGFLVFVGQKDKSREWGDVYILNEPNSHANTTDPNEGKPTTPQTKRNSP